jgi:flagellar hook assembly protein FlgD
VAAFPTTFALKPNEPNPFERNTLIRFDVPGMSDLSIKIYDAEGRLVKTLIQGKTEPGRHSVTWTGDGSSGNPAGPGLYFIKMEAAEHSEIRKVVVLR